MYFVLRRVLTACRLGLLFTVVIVALNGCSTLKERLVTPTPSLIASGVTIDNVPVGGLSRFAAASAMKSAVSSAYGKVQFRLRDPSSGMSFYYTLSDFGGYFDIDSAVDKALEADAGTKIKLPLRLNENLVKLHVSRIADVWRVPMQELKVKFTAKCSKLISRGHPGRKLEQIQAVADVMNSLPSLKNPLATVSMPFTISYPEVPAEHVEGLADTLVSYTTTFNPANATRTNNLLLAVDNINGTVVGPGEVFSYNDSVGPRTAQTGFQDAIIYVDNRMKKDVGGGICQASSTLYNCVLLANLPVIERHAHSLPVHYVPAGRDATVAWGGDDFKFENNTAKPIIIRCSAAPGGTLTESLIGDRSSLPHPTAQVAIDVTPKVTYPDGFSVSSYRVVKEDGVLIAKEDLGTSFYHNLVGGVPH